MSMNDTLKNSSINENVSTIFHNLFVQKILLGCLLFGLAIFTVFGNLLVLYAIRTEKRLRTVSNLFILSLAFADLVVGLVVMPLSAANIITGQWPFSFLICQIWLSIDYVASTASIFNLVLLSLDRYWAVVYPLVYIQTRSRRRATHFILIIWFVSLLWVPAIVFWSYFFPQYSDFLKPSECDTSFRLNKTFKTLTALVNFYLPLFTMIIISCRIMIAIRSRSTMEFGRRISSTKQRQMRRDRTITNVSLGHQDIERSHRLRLSSIENDEQPATVSIVINPFESVVENTNIPSSQSDENTELSVHNHDDNDSLSHQKSSFRLSQLKPIKMLFPSLSSIKDTNQRKSEILLRRYSNQIIMKNSLSVANNMKYSDRESKHLSRTLSNESSFSDECEQQIPIPVESLSPHMITPSSSPSHTTKPSIIFTDIGLSPSTNMNILTFFDYIINPSLSSSLQKELKAARQLGMLVGAFTVTWLPYFILFLVVAWCQQCVSDRIFTIFIWLGYLNSTLNPLIYPLCNKHFRHAFRKIFYCHHAKTKLPNLTGLRELHALHSIRYRR